MTEELLVQEESSDLRAEPGEHILRPTDLEKGIRLDKFVAEQLNLSRKYTAELLDQGNILFNNAKVKNSTKVNNGDVVLVNLPELKELEVKAEPMDLKILYEDEDLLVIDKPKGLVVHPSPGHTEGTLVNGLLAHCTELSGVNGVMRPGIVHRIDKDTSGLLVVAKNDLAHRGLAEQLADKSCRRTYLAIVHNPFSHQDGTIQAPIGRDPKDRQKMAVTEVNSKDATTHFRVLENFKNYALVECKLETGRTHQIRVHMSYISHPVAGDPKYGPRKTLEADGQLLHAWQLDFIHPRSKKPMHFESEPDEQFLSILETLRKENE